MSDKGFILNLFSVFFLAIYSESDLHTYRGIAREGRMLRRFL